MIVDTSALIAVVGDEPTSERLVEILRNSRRSRISAASLVEAWIVADRHSRVEIPRRLDRLIEYGRLECVAVDLEQAGVARAAYRDYGRGSGHPARLNYGDCFSYALARVTDEPLLYVGDDFSHTDVVPALT